MLLIKSSKVLPIILLNLLNLKSQWIIKDPASLGSLSNRSESMSKLLSNIVHNYFGGCVLIILYDDTFIFQQTGTIDKIFKSLPEVSYIQKKVNLTMDNSIKINIDKCYSYLIFLDNIHDIGKIINKEAVNKVVVITESTPWTVKEFLKSHPSRSYTNLLIITHSMSRRTEAGSYLLYTHRLYVDGSGKSQPVLLTSWIRDNTTKIRVNLFPEKLSSGFKGHRLLISTAHKPPYTIRTNIVSREAIDWDGIDVRLIRLLGKTLNFTADFRDPIANDSPIYAALTDVTNSEAIIATGGIYKTANITKKYDTSFNHMEDCAAFISKSSTALPKYQAVLGPFDPAVWILVLFVYLIAILPFTMNTNYTFKSLITKPSRLLHMFWYVFSTFTNSFIVKNPLLDSGIAKNATSLLIGVYWIFTIIITSCYTGSIMAFITVPMFPAPTESAEQLLHKRYTIGTLNHDGWENWFNYTNMTDPVGIRLLKSLDYVPSIEAGIKNTSKAFFWSYAFLGSKVLLEYIVQDQFPPNMKTMRSSMHISKKCFVNFGVTLALPKDSIYTEPINKVIIRARQSGLTQKIIRDVEWDIQRTAEGRRLPISNEWKTRKLPAEDRQLALDDTQGMFLILFAGVILGCISLLAECCVHKIKKKRAHSIYPVTIDSIDGESTLSTPRMSHLEVPLENFKRPLLTGRPRSC